MPSLRRFGSALALRLAPAALAVVSCARFGPEPLGDLDASAADSGDASASADAMLDATMPDTTPPDAPSSPPASCKDLRAASNGPMADGPFVVVLGDAGATRVWCDMTTDGGGWTLVGRSVQGSTSPFGWNASAGDVDDNTKAYSLDVFAHPIAFTELLIGESAPAKKWGKNVFKVTVPPDFLTTYATTTVSLVRPNAMVIGTCKPASGKGWIFAKAGHTTDAVKTFFLCDDPSNAGCGLAVDRFRLAGACCGGTDCDRTAELDQKTGMIFVR